MPRYQAQGLGGINNSGVMPNSRPQVDLGGLVDAAARAFAMTKEGVLQRAIMQQQNQRQQEAAGLQREQFKFQQQREKGVIARAVAQQQQERADRIAAEDRKRREQLQDAVTERQFKIQQRQSDYENSVKLAKIQAGLRPAKEVAADRTEEKRQAYVLKRIRELTKASKDDYDDETPGISVEDAQRQAEIEWGKVQGRESPQPTPKPIQEPNPKSDEASGDIDLRGAQREYDALARGYQAAIAQGAPPDLARKRYDALVLQVAKKYGQVK
jgi:hypothetical protein